ncbi:MAG: YciI family protein [Cyclobacteriaceae bacterium]
MKKYLYLFRGGDGRNVNQSPQQMQEHMEKWGVWMNGLNEKGILDSGLPLANEGKVVAKKGQDITDGPFAEGAEIVGGYLIVNAKNLEEATNFSKECPIFEYEGTVEVREISSMEM